MGSVKVQIALSWIFFQVQGCSGVLRRHGLHFLVLNSHGILGVRVIISPSSRLDTELINLVQVAHRKFFMRVRGSNPGLLSEMLLTLQSLNIFLCPLSVKQCFSISLYVTSNCSYNHRIILFAWHVLLLSSLNRRDIKDANVSSWY